MNTTDHSTQEPTEIEMNKVRENVKATQKIQDLQNKSKFKWNITAVTIIKEKLQERKEKNLYNGNDWKVRFYEEKLQDKKSILGKLKKLLK